MRIFCDADDVLINTVECWVELINKTYNQNVKPETVTDWDATKAYPNLTKEQVYGVLNADTLWYMVEPLPGSKEYLKRLLDDGHEVYITTASDYRTASAKNYATFGNVPLFNRTAHHYYQKQTDFAGRSND